MSDEYPEAMGPPGDMAYRTPVELPFELSQHAGIFFEERLYTQALNLLFNTLASGTFASNKAVIPSPQHLALAGTFLVHPSTTTRAKSPEQKEAANVALRLLRLISTLVSPQDAKLDEAFCFKRAQTSRSGRVLHPDDQVSSNLPHDRTDWKTLDVANESSLWSRADGFWHAVGWAFNCSVLHPERWERWQIWLQFMCDILQDDWRERERQYKETQAKKQTDTKEASPEEEEEEEKEEEEEEGKSIGSRTKKDDGLGIFRDSLIFQYISADTGSGRNRRTVRAVFADGSSASVNEFRQVFHKELRHNMPASRTEQPKKRDREVNIEKEEYGDYLSQDESDEEAYDSTDPSKPASRSTSPPATGPKARRSKRTRRGTRNAADPSHTEPVETSTDTDRATLTHHGGGISPMGGLDSLGLRKKLLSILSTVSERLPDDFMPVYELYHLFVENIRHLPLPIFQTFVSPYVLPELSDAEQTTLCELLLFCMRESSAPDTDEEYLNQTKLEQCFLPFAATSARVVDNAKVSILLEALIILLANSDMLSVTPSFQQAVETGILRRAERAQEDLRRSQASRGNETLEWCWLVESGERLVFLMELVTLQSSRRG